MQFFEFWSALQILDCQLYRGLLHHWRTVCSVGFARHLDCICTSSSNNNRCAACTHFLWDFLICLSAVHYHLMWKSCCLHLLSLSWYWLTSSGSVVLDCNYRISFFCPLDHTSHLSQLVWWRVVQRQCLHDSHMMVSAISSILFLIRMLWSYCSCCFSLQKAAYLHEPQLSQSAILFLTCFNVMYEHVLLCLIY